MSNATKQSNLFRGIYDFDDPSGSLLAAKVPAAGSVDLYSGTAVIVRPNQCAIFVYKGQISDILFSGTHEIKTDNVPILSKLANWKFGFQNPLRCELIFVAGHLHTGRRWGTSQPILINIDDFGAVPIRAYGNFSVIVSDPQKVYTKLMGTRFAYSISDLEEFIQGQIIELLPDIFSSIKSFEQLGANYNELSKKLESALNDEINEFGISVRKIQLLSALPSKEIIEAIDAKTAIKVIGSQKDYLLYKAANSMSLGKDGTANDPMQMMMGLMLGKGLIGSDYNDKEEKVTLTSITICPSCDGKTESSSKFCPQCGKRLS